MDENISKAKYEEALNTVKVYETKNLPKAQKEEEIRKYTLSILKHKEDYR